MTLTKIEPRFNPQQREAIERAIGRFHLDAEAARHYFHTIYTAPDEEAEILICAGDPQYFITEYCRIYDPQAQDWIAFDLWPEQIQALEALHDNQLVIALKARQVGLTWLGLAYALWLMLFRPIATVLLFSKREDEAIYLLGKERLRGMYDRLPDFLRAKAIEVDNATQLKLSNGSIAYSFPTTGGDSYTASYVLVDEADLVPDFNRLMRSVKPTIDAGGKLFLVSRADKSKPESEFKKIYQAARQRLNNWMAIFLPWWIRPERTPEWYEDQKRDILARTGNLDDLMEQYPATDIEALAGRTADKRISADWLNQCYQEKRPLGEAILREEKCPAIPGLLVYTLPIRGRRYVGGVDPAEGNPTSDDSAAVFLDEMTGEEVAMLSGKFQPSTLAGYVDQVGRWLNGAAVMIERNNHGHAVLLWLRDHSNLRRLTGWDANVVQQDGQRHEGWLSNSRGKALLYDGMADCCRDGQTVIHSAKCLHQLMSIEGSTLRAPEGQMDDCSDAYALAVQARNMPRGIFVG